MFTHTMNLKKKTVGTHNWIVVKRILNCWTKKNICCYVNTWVRLVFRWNVHKINIILFIWYEISIFYLFYVFFCWFSYPKKKWINNRLRFNFVAKKSTWWYNVDFRFWRISLLVGFFFVGFGFIIFRLLYKLLYLNMLFFVEKLKRDLCNEYISDL